MKFTLFHEAIKTIPDYLINDMTRVSDMHDSVIALHPDHRAHIWQKGTGWKISEPAAPISKAGGTSCMR